MTTLLIVDQKGDGKRLDVYLTALLPLVSRSAVQSLCAGGKVWVNKKTADKKQLLKVGDQIEYILDEPVKLNALPENILISIIHEDPHLLVVNKPRGMVVHPAPGNNSGTMVNALLYHCKDSLSSINGVIRPGIVHRIDKDTSGLLLVAKDDPTHIGLSEQFAVHSIDRVYYAVLHGTPKEETGRVEAPIGRHPINRKKMAITEKNGRFAATCYEVVESFRGFSLVKLKLETGRTHQIRVHMASLGYPVAGDTLYGPSKPALKGGQCLHASVLGFTHPITRERLLFESPLPDYFLAFLKAIGKEGE